MKTKFWVACFLIIFAMIFLAMNARSAEGWGGLTVPVKNLYLNGVVCNTAEQSRQVFEDFEKKGAPLFAVLFNMNRGKVVCSHTAPFNIIVSKTTLIHEERLGGKTAYFYEGNVIGVKTSKGDIPFDRPALLYFYTVDTPLNPEDEGDGA